jgi:hypothetical protein
MKSKIIIHNPTNFQTKNYRYYNIFFDKLVTSLYKDFDIIENRYFIDAHKYRFPVKLLYDTSDASHSTILLECEMILENFNTKQLKILSVGDFLTDANIGLFNNEAAHSHIQKILISQFNKQSILNHTYNKSINDVYSPWIYFPSNSYNLEYFFNERQKISSLIDKFYFRGSGLEHRPLLKYFNRSLFDGGLPIGNFDNYAKELINYKIGFSCAGSAQFCYRDIEYMAMGIPMIRFQYTNEMNPPLVPNFHYISVDPATEHTVEHKMTEEYAKIIENRFFEIKDDVEFLQFISNNAREYYLNFIHDNSGIQNTLKILNIEDWL